MKDWIIYDWAENKPFDEKLFKSFNDAEDFLTIWLNEKGNYEEDRQEYYIEEKQEMFIWQTNGMRSF